ncbi:MAG: tyrosine-type recombinase/integrase [Blautia sp.]|nr:tyrosine-type recombinase/integrase [Blautia sp.]
MNTVTCATPDGRIRYYLADEQGVPVPEVMNYLKFLDNQGKARNTLRLSCYQLQNYYRFLKEAGKDYRDVTIDDIARFMAWLRNPDLLKKVVPIRFEPARKEQTINENIDKVISFYDYLVRRGGLENRLSEKLVKFVTHPQRSYKSFLYGIAENRPTRSSILKMPVSQREIRRIKKEEAAALLGECTNLRDYFLLYLLFETGMRIGEALSLWLEDFDLDGLKISITDRGELENLAEIKTVHSPRNLDCTQELTDLFMGYVCEVHTCDINTNHVFLKLRGENAGKPMDYTDVDNLFRTLRKKTGILITPHVFRHTSLSLLYADGWAPELLRIRAGHKNIYTTINTYIHPTEEELTAEFNKAAPHLSRPDFGKKEGDA